MNGDNGSRGERGGKGVWRGRGHVRELRRPAVYEWVTPEAVRRWRGLENPAWATLEKRDGEERFHGKKAWRK